MSAIEVIVQYIRLFSILFKHWLCDLFQLCTGGAPLKNLSADTVLITGAASGLGKGLAERLAHLGCVLVLWDVDGVSNARVADELNSATKSKRIHAMKCDLTSRESIYECAKKVQETIGNVTMVINNAGVVSGKALLDCSDASIQRTFDVNVIAHFWILKAFLPWMLENNHGHIVTIASGAGLTGTAGLVDYCSSKFAAVGLHESLTHELHAMRKTGVRTTVVCPSFIDTGMFEGAKTSVLFPLLRSTNVCDEIVTAIRKNEHMLLLPKVLRLGLILKSMTSTAAQLDSQDSVGLNQSMETFVGRRDKAM